MRRLALGLVALCAACGGSVASGDDGDRASVSDEGTLAPDHRAAVLIATATSKGVSYCSSTLVAPDLLLTAAHCVHPAYVGAGAKVRALLAGQAYDDLGHALAGTVTLDEAFVPTITDGKASHDPRLGHDLAFVRLAGVVDGVEPVPVVRTAIDDSYLGAHLALLGFSKGDGEVGPRREATMSVASIDAHGLMLDAITGQVCRGDSGAPALMRVGERDRLVGVLAAKRGTNGKPCGELGAYITRLDAHAPFLDRFLPPAPPSELPDVASPEPPDLGL